jgi:hypothetical protein
MRGKAESFLEKRTHITFLAKSDVVNTEYNAG